MSDNEGKGEQREAEEQMEEEVEVEKCLRAFTVDIEELFDMSDGISVFARKRMTERQFLDIKAYVDGRISRVKASLAQLTDKKLRPEGFEYEYVMEAGSILVAKEITNVQTLLEFIERATVNKTLITELSVMMKCKASEVCRRVEKLLTRSKLLDEVLGVVKGDESSVIDTLQRMLNLDNDEETFANGQAKGECDHEDEGTIGVNRTTPLNRTFQSFQTPTTQPEYTTPVSFRHMRSHPTGDIEFPRNEGDSCSAKLNLSEQAAGDTNEIISVLARNMFLASLPPLTPFGSQRGENLGQFLSELKLRFSPLLTREDKITMLRSNLRDTARQTFIELCSSSDHLTYEQLCVELKAKLDDSSSLRRVHLQRELQLYTKNGNKSIQNMCGAIEDLARRAYPKESKRFVESQLASVLLRNLEGRPEFAQYMEASKNEAGEFAANYKAIKEVALRYEEYDKIRAEESRKDEVRGRDVGSGRVTNNSGKRFHQQGRRTTSNHVHETSRPWQQGGPPRPTNVQHNNFNANRINGLQSQQNRNGYAQNNQNASGQTPRNVQCYQCGQPGHFRYQCPRGQMRAEELVLPRESAVDRVQLKEEPWRIGAAGAGDISRAGVEQRTADGGAHLREYQTHVLPNDKVIVAKPSYLPHQFLNELKIGKEKRSGSGERLRIFSVVVNADTSRERESSVMGEDESAINVEYGSHLTEHDGTRESVNLLCDSSVAPLGHSLAPAGQLCNIEERNGSRALTSGNGIQLVTTKGSTNVLEELVPISMRANIDPYRAEQLVLAGEVANIECNVVVDTGASISYVSTGFLKKLDEDPDKRAILSEEAGSCMEIGTPDKYSVFDASHNVIPLVGRCCLPASIEKGEVTPVCFHVMKRDDVAVLVGMNALKSLGFRLAIYRKEEDDDEKVYVDRRTYLPPGAARVIPVRSHKRNSPSLIRAEELIKETTVIQFDAEGKAFLPVVNESEEAILLTMDQCIGSLEEVEIESWEVLDEIVLQLPDVACCNEMMELEYESTPMGFEERIEEIIKVLIEKGMPETPELKQLIRENVDVFALCDEDLGRAHGIEHRVETGEARPIRQRARPVPLALRDPVRKLLDKMKKDGIVRQSRSPWTSPCVLVKKKDGSVRLCVDFRKINEVMKQDAYPLPNMDQTLHSMTGKVVFSTFDLMSGFWQMPMEERSKCKTAFAILDELLEFEVMPFGLSNAPASFQRMMHLVMDGLIGENYFVYIDDVIVASERWSDHVNQLRELFARLRMYNLRLKASKCCIGQKKVHFLGHVLSEEGISVDPDKITKIENCPRPSSVEEIRRFLGMCSYYRKFVLHFSKIAGPLYDLTSSSVKWSWGEAQEKAFEALKKILTTAPVLIQPDMKAAVEGTRPFIVYVDASKMGVGGVLCQEFDDGKIHPIHFMSKRLLKYQKNYHPTDLEAYAIKTAVEKFRQYIYGVKTIIRTDHQALVSLLKRRDLAERTMRWALELQDENLKIEYVKGALNSVADALSRGPLVLSEKEETGDMEKLGLDRVLNEINELSTGYTDSWTENLQLDTGYKKLLKDLKEGNLNASVQLNGEKVFPLKVQDFIVDKGILLVLHNAKWVRWVPIPFREEIWISAHDSAVGGHVGVKKVEQKVKSSYFWPKMGRDFTNWHKGCVKCLLANPKPPQIPPLIPRSPCGPFEVIAVDLVDMGQPTLRGNKFMLTIIDQFTKFGYAEALPSKSASVVGAAIVAWTLRGCRIPTEFYSDKGKEFMNEIIQTACKQLGIVWNCTKGYSKRENGLAERFNRTIESILRKIVQVETEWDTMIPFALFAYNSTVHSATSESPCFVNSGRDPVLPLKTIDPRLLNVNFVDVDSYKTDMLAGLQVLHQDVKQRLQVYADKMKADFDKQKASTCQIEWKVGERAFVYMPAEKAASPNPKLVNPYRGPYRVVGVGKTSLSLREIHDPASGTLTVQMEMVRKIPNEIDDTRIVTKTKRQPQKPLNNGQMNEGKVVVARKSARLREKKMVINEIFLRLIIGRRHCAHKEYVLDPPVCVADIFTKRRLPVPSGFAHVKAKNTFLLAMAFEVVGQCPDPTTYYESCAESFPSVPSMKEALAYLADTSETCYAEYEELCQSREDLEVEDLKDREEELDWAALLMEARLPSKKVAIVSAKAVENTAKIVKERDVVRERKDAETRIQRQISEASVLAVGTAGILVVARRAFSRQRLYGAELRAAEDLLPELKRIRTAIGAPSSVRTLILQIPPELAQLETPDQGFQEISDILREIKNRCKNVEIVAGPAHKLSSTSWKNMRALSLLLINMKKIGIRTLNVMFNHIGSWSIELDNYVSPARDDRNTPYPLLCRYWDALRTVAVLPALESSTNRDKTRHNSSNNTRDPQNKGKYIERRNDRSTGYRKRPHTSSTRR